MSGAPSEHQAAPGPGRWDPLVTELLAVRRAAGEPSFGEVARRISERRIARGATPDSARVARTTVYDAFRPGRARMNVPLVREIVAALDVDPAVVDAWVAACEPARAPSAAPSAQSPPSPPGSQAPDEEPLAPTPPAEPDPSHRARPRTVLLLVLACIAVNLGDRFFVELLDLPIHLDMVGTAVVAIAVGPWCGAGVGVATNLLGVASSGPVSIPFALVNVAGALVWGYGTRRFGLGRTLPRFLGLTLLVALVCTLVAVPILLLAYGGGTGNGTDTITATFLGLTHERVLSVGFSNLLVSVSDKLISGFVALVVISTLPRPLRRGVPGAPETLGPSDIG